MAHRRPWHCYSKWNRRPYQHKRSANHRREFARGGAQSKIQRFWGGAKSVPWKQWDLVVSLKVDKQIQISSNALETIRVTVNSILQKKIGRNNYRLRVRPKPFQKIRENRMLAFAGADRVQSGMRNSFGRSTGVCARVRAGQVIMDVGINLKHLPLLRNRYRIATMKLPCSCQTVITKYKSTEILKRAGLPLYDAEKRREIPLYELELSAAEAAE
ncbi:MAG: 50S ribosomal protein L16 [Candidatus Lokiarchaeota archaeon]|nr:50S ribosomal protein L16 [Candidatus Lokiarchaeota archaeon]MBD3342832.1 50S ribosomal protein L16 [Candidatus Lokiarchaeota archaeon]